MFFVWLWCKYFQAKKWTLGQQRFQYLWEEGRGKDTLLKIRKYMKLVVSSPQFYFLAPCFGWEGWKRREEGKVKHLWILLPVSNGWETYTYGGLKCEKVQNPQHQWQQLMTKFEMSNKLLSNQKVKANSCLCTKMICEREEG